VADQHNTTGDLILKAVVPAGGISYKLIYNELPEDSYYLGTGNEINRLFGLKTLQLTERLLIDLTEEYIPRDKDIPENYCGVRRKLLSGGIKELVSEILIITPSGEKKWILDTSVPVVDDKTGKVTGLAGVFFDISEQKKDTDAASHS
jgi:PAS domain-containing protein